jgi:hypothetical protein
VEFVIFSWTSFGDERLLARSVNDESGIVKSKFDCIRFICVIYCRFKKLVAFALDS